MNNVSSFAALVTTMLIGIAAGSAWSHEVSPGAATIQTPARSTDSAPDWYPPPPPPNMGGYARPWQQPSRWPVSPQGYGQWPRPYPSYEQYQMPAPTPTTAVNPLSAELKYTQEQLSAKNMELDELHTTLEQLRVILQHRLIAEITLNEELEDITRKQQTLQLRVTELTTQPDSTTDQQQIHTLTAERDRLHDDLASRDEQLATLQTELQAATQASQQAQTETTTSNQQLSDARAQSEALKDELIKLQAQPGTRSATLMETAQTLGKVIAERDGLQAELAAHSEELSRAQAALTISQSETEALRQDVSAAAVVVTDPATSKELDAGTVEIAALQTADLDTDKDGVADSIDLCRETKQGIAVESTGCAAGAAINLEGVSFRYNSHELTDKAQRTLDHVADILGQQPNLRLEVAGHTDAQGDSSYNQWLSLKRAETVRDYLVAQGLNPRHIGAGGYGGQQPIADNTTKEGLRMNRRVELRRLQ